LCKTGEASQPSQKKIVMEKLNHSTPSVAVENKLGLEELGQDVVGNENI